MKFYDLEWLASKCGTDNKYEITVKVAAEARRESEESIPLREKNALADERFISNVLLEIEEDESPISVNYKPSNPVIPVEVVEVFEDSQQEQSQNLESESESEIDSEEEHEEKSEAEPEAEPEKISTEALSLNE